ncbi:MAG: hypothetical protein HY438_02240 [DPANN group archaeon]|nr:hypothetical protein [DPANN group archaeon]
MDTEIQKLLGLTEQQLDILKGIDRTSTLGKSRPKDIEQAYKTLTGKLIQKSNMFAQLRELQLGEFVIKTNSFYYVNKNKIKQVLLEKKKILGNEVSKCEALTKNIDNFFKSGSEPTILRCLNKEQLFEHNLKVLRDAEILCKIGDMPNVLQSDIYKQNLGSHEYSRILIEKCSKGQFTAKYIVSLRPEKTFLRLFSKIKDKKRTYELTAICYDNLIKLLTIPNLQFRYLSIEFGTFNLAIGPTMASLQLPLRTSVYELAGGIIIENKDICESYNTMFDKLYESAQPINIQLVKKIARKNLKELRDSMDKLIKEYGFD